ncbi:MAG: Eco57I restriction-modification methylase domain-containing protein [bacterium]
MRVGTLKGQLAQEFLPGLSPVASAIEEFAAAGTDDRGAIFTRSEVVDFILDLVGYVPSNELYAARLLEPSFGHGDFLIPAVKRLMSSLKTRNIKPSADLLRDSIRGVELHMGSFDKTRKEVRAILLQNGLTIDQSEEILGAWLVQGDFLLTPFGHSFTHVVGNPPYIRQEMVPNVLMAEYRRRYETIYDRADIFIPFIEYSLKLLDEGGTLGFICADRWMKNRYGGPLRELVAKRFHMRTYVDMVGTPAFHSEVIAYPAITVIARESAGPTYVAKRPEIEASALEDLARALVRGALADHESVKVTTITGGDPWTLEESDTLALIRRLESDFPTLEETGCKVGIGVATGADDVFIAPFDTLDVEAECKLPLVMTKDIQTGTVAWRGLGVVNPFGNDGKPVSLEKYPRLRAYLGQHEVAIRNRHVSKKNPSAWYRTIDRIYPELVQKPKLLIPDIKGDAHIVYDEGKLYPHHNLYYITSDEWDLQALRAVLLSGIARVFIETYSTRMHGNCLRFQAQYLRRIRLPRWSDVSKDLQQALRAAAGSDDSEARDEAVSALFSLSPSERATIKA